MSIAIIVDDAGGGEPVKPPSDLPLTTVESQPTELKDLTPLSPEEPEIKFEVRTASNSYLVVSLCTPVVYYYMVSLICIVSEFNRASRFWYSRAVT